MPTSNPRYLGVYDSRDLADRALARARSADQTIVDVRVDDAEDRRLALYGDMQQEAGRSAPMVSSAVTTPHQMKGAMTGVLVATPIGAVVGALVGLFPIVDLPLIYRMLIGAIAIGAAASTVGFVAGGGLGGDGPAEPNTTDRGVVLGLTSADDRIRAALFDGSTRVWRVDPGSAQVRRLHDEGAPAETAPPLAEHLDQPTGGTWAEDQAEARRTPDEPRPRERR